MNVQGFFIAACLVAGATAVPVFAGQHEPKASRDDQGPTSDLRAITVTAKAGESGHGWQYFADARHGRAVVISPSGDYYFSRGDGLKRVFKAN